jgi:hypothetical protein
LVDKGIPCFVHELDPGLPQIVGHCLRYLPGYKNGIFWLATSYQREHDIRPSYQDFNFRNKIHPFAMSLQRKTTGAWHPHNFQGQTGHARESRTRIWKYSFFWLKISHDLFK